MDRVQFYKESSRIFDKIIASIETNPEYDDIDVDYQDDVLYLTSPYGKFVLNKHSPTMKIWLSSPVSGAHYFEYNNGQWQDAVKLELELLILSELEIK